MKNLFMNKILILILAIVVIVGGYLFVSRQKHTNTPENNAKIENSDSIDPSLFGSWQSVDDKSFVRVLNEDNTFKDMYNEELTSSGTWFVFDSSNAPENITFPISDDKKYLMMNDTSLSLVFEIVDSDREKLVLIYLDGGILEFKRI